MILRSLGIGLVTRPRSPGWKPGDSGYENHPVIHAARRCVMSWFRLAPHGTRDESKTKRTGMILRPLEIGRVTRPKKPRVETRGLRA